MQTQTRTQMFKYIWRNRYLIHEVLAFNHDCDATVPCCFGYINALKYSSYLNFKPINANTAILNGQLPVLQWLHNNRKDCTIKQIEMWNASLMGDLDIMRWLYNNVKPSDQKKWDLLILPMHECVYNGSLDIIKWIYENSPDFTKCLINRTRKKNPELSDWIHENKKDCGNMVIPDLLSHEEWWNITRYENKSCTLDLETFQWLYEKSQNFNTKTLIMKLLHKPVNTDKIKWLYSQL